MIFITETIQISDSDIQVQFVKSQGAGGQNVNKVATAVHLRFCIKSSQGLSHELKQRLLKTRDHRITKEGILVIKAQSHRSQEKNRQEAIQRLSELIKAAAVTQRKRKKTRPSLGSQKRRLDKKAQRSQTKSLRGRVAF